jgi:hypothetical protein
LRLLCSITIRSKLRCNEMFYSTLIVLADTVAWQETNLQNWPNKKFPSNRNLSLNHSVWSLLATINLKQFQRVKDKGCYSTIQLLAYRQSLAKKKIFNQNIFFNIISCKAHLCRLDH